MSNSVHTIHKVQTLIGGAERLFATEDFHRIRIPDRSVKVWQRKVAREVKFPFFRLYAEETFDWFGSIHLGSQVAVHWAGVPYGQNNVDLLAWDYDGGIRIGSPTLPGDTSHDVRSLSEDELRVPVNRLIASLGLVARLSAQQSL